MADSLSGAIPSNAMHLCIDMQRLFSQDGPWPTPWMPRVVPIVQRLVEAHPSRTVFTRFLPPHDAREMHGQWKTYYERWREATLSELDPSLVGLMPDLRKYVPPARVADKMTYSALASAEVHALLPDSDCVIVTGAETDVCVLSSIMGLVEMGKRTIVVSDAVCSSSDQGHDYLLTLFRQRFSYQIEVATSDEVLDAWARG